MARLREGTLNKPPMEPLLSFHHNLLLQMKRSGMLLRQVRQPSTILAHLMGLRDESRTARKSIHMAFRAFSLSTLCPFLLLF